MDKDFLVKLTNKLYHLTLLFPKKEPLRYKMRELADDILAKSLSGGLSSANLKENLEVLDCFFEVAKKQNWVQPEAVLEIQRDYSKIRDDLEKRENQGGVRTSEVIVLSQENFKKSYPQFETKVSGQEVLEEIGNNRQQKILEILREKGRVQVWEMKKIFPELNKRTLRRDFGYLLKQGLVERIGERNETFYKLKRQDEDIG